MKCIWCGYAHASARCPGVLRLLPRQSPLDAVTDRMLAYKTAHSTLLGWCLANGHTPPLEIRQHEPGFTP